MKSATELIYTIRSFANTYPDFVYRRPEGHCACSNIDGGCDKYPNKGCIVGQAMRSLGFEVTEHGQVSTMCKQLGVDLSFDQRSWLNCVQTSQDCGKPWADAITEADNSGKIALLINEVEYLAKEYPDFLYKTPGSIGCSNVDGGCDKYPELKGCIVGQALQRLGVDLTEHPKSGIFNILISNRWVFTQAQRSRLEDIQLAQDTGSTWSQAIAN
jgi:hypothetical protein